MAGDPRPSVKPKTFAGYRHDIDHYIVPSIGRMRLQALRPAVISKFYRDLLSTAAETADRCRHGRSLTSTAPCARHSPTLLTSSNCWPSTRPHDQAPRRPASAEPTQIWTTGQLDLPDCRPVSRLFAFYRLAAYTGARRGELLYLRWQAVDLDAAEVTFGGSTAVVRGQRVEGTTKGGRSRTISIDSETVAVLREHHRQQATERQAAGSAWNDSGGLVFTTRWGEPLYPDTVSALMGKLISEYNKSAVSPGQAAAACPAARSASPARHHAAAGRGSCSRGGRPAWPRRPGRHVAGLLPRTPRARRRHRGHLRPGRERPS